MEIGKNFSSNGINMADIARLTWQDVKEDHIVFTRKKTAEASGQETTIPLTETNARIIERYGLPSRGYVFPILKPGMNDEQQRKAWKQATKHVNKYLRKIQDKTGIQVEGGDRLTTYTARHSLSELLFARGVNDLLIADMLGHSSAKTARDNYRSRSSIEAQRRAIEDILPPGESA